MKHGFYEFFIVFYRLAVRCRDVDDVHTLISGIYFT